MSYPPDSPYHKTRQTPRISNRARLESAIAERLNFEKNYFGESLDFDEDDMSKGNIRKITVPKEANEGFGFVIKGENPIFICEIKPDSAAAKAGLQVGDRILSVNEISVKNFNRDKIVAILVGCGKNPSVTILDGKEQG